MQVRLHGALFVDYIDAEIAEIEMPANTVSDDTIETLKSIYSMYLEWKEKQE